MFPAAMSNSTSLSEEASVSSGTRVQEFGSLNPLASNFSPLQHQQQQQKIIKKKRSLPGNPGRFSFRPSNLVLDYFGNSNTII